MDYNNYRLQQALKKLPNNATIHGWDDGTVYADVKDDQWNLDYETYEWYFYHGQVRTIYG